MTDSHEHQAREEQLELLLQELLGEAPDASGGALKVEVAPEVAELADVARRLLAESQSIPLPEGQKVLRQARWPAGPARLNGHAPPASGAAHQRLRRRFVAAAAAVAAALFLGVFGAGTSLAWSVGSPSSPWYGTRVAIAEFQVALVPSPWGKAKLLVKATRTRIAEIETIASSGDTPALRRAADVLDGEAGWLHAVMTRLSAADQDQVISELTAVTGTFSEATLIGLSRGSTSPVAEPSGRGSADRSARVSTVARAAAQLRAEGKLLPGVTVGDLVSQAARGETGTTPGSSVQGEHGVRVGIGRERVKVNSNKSEKSTGNRTKQAGRLGSMTGRQARGTNNAQVSGTDGMLGNTIGQAQGGSTRVSPRRSTSEGRALEGPAGRGGLFGSGSVGFAGSHLNPYSGGFTGKFRWGPIGGHGAGTSSDNGKGDQ